MSPLSLLIASFVENELRFCRVLIFIRPVGVGDIGFAHGACWLDFQPVCNALLMELVCAHREMIGVWFHAYGACVVILSLRGFGIVSFDV